jgi:monoamine oxidase
MLNTTMTTLFCVDPDEVSLLGALVLARGGGSFEPCTERLRIQRSRAAHLPGPIDRQAFRHAIEPPEREPQAGQAKESDFGNALVPTVRTVEMHDGIAPFVLRIDLQAVFAAQREHAMLPFAKPRAAHRDHGAVGGRPVPNASAHAVARLEQRDRFSAIPQPQRRRKAGESRADNAVVRPYSFLLSGSALRGITICDEPFWRNDGLSGMSVAPDLPVPVALDQSPRSGNPGILSSYMFGPQAVRAAALNPAERRDIWLRALAARYGVNALSPRAHLETDWAAEEWSLGGMIAHFAPGVLTSFGQALHEPAGRIHPKSLNSTGVAIG